VIYSTTGLEENPVSTSSAEVKTDANKLWWKLLN
jgi:hypothetical protein